MASRDYPDDLVQKALELGAAIGIRPAAKQLEVPFQTIHGWTKHPDYAPRWAELRHQHAPAWRKRMAATLEELVDDYTAYEAKVLEDVTGRDLEKLETRDVGNLLRSVAVAKGVTADHVGKLRGQPDVVVERRVDAAQLEQAMQRLLEQAPAVDSTAEEITPDELPEGDECPSST
jgi:hypothetical protein